MYKVLGTFKDLKDNGHIYFEGDIFPHEQSAVEKFKDSRMEELLTDKNKIGEPLIELVSDGQEADPSETEAKEFPKHIGGGNYELSNGDKVKGRAEAVAAEAALKE